MTKYSQITQFAHFHQIPSFFTNTFNFYAFEHFRPKLEKSSKKRFFFSNFQPNFFQVFLTWLFHINFMISSNNIIFIFSLTIRPNIYYLQESVLQLSTTTHMFRIITKPIYFNTWTKNNIFFIITQIRPNMFMNIHDGSSLTSRIKHVQKLPKNTYINLNPSFVQKLINSA